MFLPSTHGFKFDNAFPDEPNVIIAGVPLGNAGNGVCGGMAFAVADYYYADIPIPEDVTPPDRESPLFKYLIRRFIDTVVPFGLFRSWYWMMTDNLAPKTYEGLPALRKALEDGPVPLTLILVKSYNPLAGSGNHQVTAYAADGDVIRIYDPNYSLDDDITFTCTPEQITHTYYGEVRGFYMTEYKPKKPVCA